MPSGILKSLVVCLAAIYLSKTAAAQQGETVAVVTLVSQATVGLTSLSQGSTIFSGDVLKTESDGQLQFRSGTAQFALDAGSSARIFKADGRMIIELAEGTVTYSTTSAENLTLFAQDVKFVPRTSRPASGRITIVSPCSVHTTVLRGSIDATSGLENKTINEAQSYSVLPENAVRYSASWKPRLSDYPDYPRDAEYHHSHTHVACAAANQSARSQRPGSAGKPGHFELLLKIGIGVGTAVALHEVLESPDKP